jgi:hypothetical protein
VIQVRLFKRASNVRDQTQFDSKSRQGRRGDGTVLGGMIVKGVYNDKAGTEKIGYFDPATDPFRTYPNGKTGLLQGPMANILIQSIPAARGVYGSMFDDSGDISVNLGIKLGLSSTSEVLNAFHRLVGKEPGSKVDNFLLVTTSMPFFLTYSIGKVTVSGEVALEINLNALANLLLNDPAFSFVHSISEFESKAASLLDERKAEVEEKKQWAIDLQKSRTI